MSERETWISLSQVGPAVPEAGGDNDPCPLDLALPSLAVEAAISFTGAHPEAYARHCVLGSYLETLHCLEMPQ